MSLSNSATDTSGWGTIFMGPNRMHETTLSRLESGTSGPVWNEATEAEYFERVKAKATEKAREILEAARAEAAAMREEARQQGYQDGLAEAQAELEEFRQAAGQTAAAVLSAIESQSEAVTSAWEDELCALVRTSVEIGIGHELKGHRAAILEALFRDAVSTLAAEQSATVYANPEDEPVIADIVASAGEEYARRFLVRGNPGLAPGSVVLESNLGLIENTIESRRNMVENILNQLALRERVDPEAFISDVELHQQIEEVAPLEEELMVAPQTPEHPFDQVHEAVQPEEIQPVAESAASESVEQESAEQNLADAESPLGSEAAAGESDAVLTSDQQLETAPVEPEDPEKAQEEDELGSLIPQELLTDTAQEPESGSVEQMTDAVQPEPVQASSGPEAVAAPSDAPRQEDKELGQAEASQAAADAILDSMFDKENG